MAQCGSPRTSSASSGALAFSRAPWLRIEQRGQVALLKAVPESLRGELIAQRRADSISIIFKVLKTYQPGSLAERSSLLKQLVDQRIPSGSGEWLSSLRTWRRWLVRVTELRIQPPDPVLLLATLDKFAVVLGKISAQVSFRLQIARAALRVDVAPSPHGIGRGDGLPRRWGVDQGGCEGQDHGGQGHAQGLRPGLQTSGARQGEGQRQGQGEEHCGLQVLPLGIRLQEGAGVRLCS